MSNTAFTSTVTTQNTYPNSSKMDWAYNLLYRKSSVKDNGAGSNTAAWTYAGPNRVVEVVLKNGIACTMLNNTRTASVVQQVIPGSGNTQNPLPIFGAAASDAWATMALTALITGVYELRSPSYGLIGLACPDLAIPM